MPPPPAISIFSSNPQVGAGDTVDAVGSLPALGSSLSLFAQQLGPWA